MTRTPTLLRLACALALATGLSACSISLERASDRAASPQAESAQPAPDQSAQPSEQAGRPMPQAGSAGASTAPGTSAPVGTGGGAAGGPATAADGQQADRPGAQVQITDTDWLDALDDPDKTMRPTGGQVLIDKNYETVVIDGDTETLSIPARGGTVVADYVQNLVVDGDYVRVFVEDVDVVTINGRGVTVVWAGSTPEIHDFGVYNELRNQADSD